MYISYGPGETGCRLPEFSSALGEPKNYTVDIVADRKSFDWRDENDVREAQLHIEIDGKIHFSSARRIAKTEGKHKDILEGLGIKLIHFKVEECIDRRDKMTDKEILIRLGI